MKDDKTVSIRNSRREIARFRLDYLWQIDEIFIMPRVTPEDRMTALRLAAQHVRNYVVERHYSALGGLLTGSSRRQLEPNKETSSQLLDFALITEDIQQMDNDELTSALRKIDVFTVEAAHWSITSALNAVVTHDLLAELGSTPSFQIIMRPRAFDDGLVAIRFSSDRRFVFWKRFDKPGSNYDLHVVPDYHPITRGRRYQHCINGDTNALISSQGTIRHIRPPAEAKRPGELWPGGGRLSFTDVNHPVYARGTSFEADISMTRILATAGVELTASLLADALGLGGQYVSVDSGFRSPYAHPSNLISAGLVRGVWEARGSEDHCFWTYRTLQAEGCSAVAHVPDWFDDEGWLNAYERFNQTM